MLSNLVTKLIHFSVCTLYGIYYKHYYTGCLQLRELREKKDSGNLRPTQGTFMNKVNNLFIWGNTCIAINKHNRTNGKGTFI